MNNVIWLILHVPKACYILGFAYVSNLGRLKKFTSGWRKFFGSEVGSNWGENWFYRSGSNNRPQKILQIVIHRMIHGFTFLSIMVNPILWEWNYTPDSMRKGEKLSYTLETLKQQRESAKSLHNSSLQ